MSDDDGLTILETLIALVIVSMAIYAISATAVQKASVLSLVDAKRFVDGAKIDAMQSGNAIAIEVEQHGLKRPLDGAVFAADGIAFSVEGWAGSSGAVVVFPSGAFSSRILGRDLVGRILDMTPVVVFDAAQSP